jgi:Zn-dependent M28 family amino/carboxypeptidase
MLDIKKTSEHLMGHVKALTSTIGERSVYLPDNLKKTADYIESFYRGIGVEVRREPYIYKNLEVTNIVASIPENPRPGRSIIIGAHYDSVMGTVGADDNASAIAVQLETARHASDMIAEDLDLTLRFVSFALEEPPVYGTRYMGSRVYAEKARKENERIELMICLEMVGYACDVPGCQYYPFPLMFMGYPEKGNFIGLVGNLKSRRLLKEMLMLFRKNRQLPAVKLTVPFNGWMIPAVRLSDHASFWDQGFKAVMVTDSAFFRNPYYHTPLDTMEKLDYHFMAELVKSLLIFFRGHGEKGREPY